MEKFDLTNELATQDMICLIMKDKNLSQEQAIKFAICQTIFRRINETGWASIALDLWGHAEYDREWVTLNEPIIEIELDGLQSNLIKYVMTKSNVKKETALGYFLIFVMEELGYHI